MELQTIFNMVLQHLARQNHGATDGEHGCAYRADEGRKCAVGYLLSDAVYDDDVEGEVVGDDNIDAAIVESIGELPYGAQAVLARLQSVHDGDYEAVCAGTPLNFCALSKERRLQRIMQTVEQLASDYDLIVPRAIYD
ncbi:hypothetical protein ABMA70_15820, partial [Halobacteriovorax sp. XZX-3]